MATRKSMPVEEGESAEGAQATTLESQMIHMIQELSGRTLRERVRTLEAALGLRNDPIQLIQVTFKLSPTLANT